MSELYRRVNKHDGQIVTANWDIVSELDKRLWSDPEPVEVSDLDSIPQVTIQKLGICRPILAILRVTCIRNKKFRQRTVVVKRPEDLVGIYLS